jgi:hypothetical protein
MNTSLLHLMFVVINAILDDKLDEHAPDLELETRLFKNPMTFGYVPCDLQRQGIIKCTRRLTVSTNRRLSSAHRNEAKVCDLVSNQSSYTTNMFGLACNSIENWCTGRCEAISVSTGLAGQA